MAQGRQIPWLGGALNLLAYEERMFQTIVEWSTAWAHGKDEEARRRWERRCFEEDDFYQQYEQWRVATRSFGREVAPGRAADMRYLAVREAIARMHDGVLLEQYGMQAQFADDDRVRRLAEANFGEGERWFWAYHALARTALDLDVGDRVIGDALAGRCLADSDRRESLATLHAWATEVLADRP